MFVVEVRNRVTGKVIKRIRVGHQYTAEFEGWGFHMRYRDANVYIDDILLVGVDPKQPPKACVEWDPSGIPLQTSASPGR